MTYTVIQVLPALDSGGVERGTLEVARALSDAGHKSIVVSAGGRLVAQLLNEGSEHIDLPIGHKSLLLLSCVPRLREIFRHADIVHVRSRFPAWLCWLALRKIPPQQRPAFITTVHGAYSVNPYSRIMTRGDRVIAVSDFIRDYITSNYPGCEHSRMITIHRGIDPAVYYPEYTPRQDWLDTFHHQYPQLGGRLVITLPGRITRLKGHEDFIRALAVLHERGHEIHGLIVGGTHPSKQPYQRELQRRINKTGLQDRISFTGHRDDLREILSTSDIVCCLSSEPESFGRTALEALCLDTPVVAYEHGGAGEILRSLFPTGLVPVGDTGGVIERIESLCKDNPGISTDNPYQLQTMLDRTLACYESCL